MNLSLPAASASAPETDRLLLALLVISLAVLALVLTLLLRYIVKYRATNPAERGEEAKKSWIFEIAWTSATLLVFFGLFVWGADLYVRLSSPPANALKIYVIGKQWMWKSEHVGGQREINSIHLPVGRPIELVMTSEDVIHDFSVPAFRIKHDVLPDRYETLWFTVTRPGVYPLYCTQFCGLDHSKMVGEVVALEAPRFEQWLASTASNGSLASTGKKLFLRYGCSGCHQGGGTDGGQGAVRAPSLAGLYGSSVPLSDGSLVRADERYLHDSIVMPGRQLVAGYSPIMPSYQGQIDEEGLLELIDYIKSLTPGAPE